jgi:glutathione S-transferase
MRLHHSPASPFVRMVMVALHETGLLGQVEMVAASGTAVEPGSMPISLNPMGKIPTLERPDGPALYDSRVILRFLDEMSGGGLYPGAPALWDTLTLEATGQGIAEAAVLIVYESRCRSPQERSEAWVEAQWQKIGRALDALEARWMSHLAGRPGAGHIAVGCALGYLDFRHADRNWREDHPGLARWEAEFATRPAMMATRPPEA